MPDESHTVTAVHGQRAWNSQQGGAMISYTIELEGLAGRHELNQKAETAPPKVGDSLFGHAEPGGEWPSGDPKPPKFKKAQQQGGGRGGPRYTAEDIARMDAVGRIKGRCHAQNMALLYAQIRATQGKLPEEFKLNDLFRIADQFTADAEAARDA